MNDEHYMRLAYDLALKAKGYTLPNPMVGCVIVKNQKVIAQGFHARCGSDHAEVVALKKAGSNASGATLYVTLEPCTHFGRTPPCVDRVIQSGVKRVVIGTKDPNPLMNGRSVARLKKAGIAVDVGVLRDPLIKLNEVFFKYIQRRMPFVVAKVAQTIDGKVATSSGESQWITSPSSRDYAKRRRNEFDAIMVGANTARIDDPVLNPQDPQKTITKIVVDSTLSISPRARLLQGCDPARIILATTPQAPLKIVDLWKKKGVEVLISPRISSSKNVNLTWLMQMLAKREISHVLIEGGGQLIGSALQQGLVDKMMIYVAPVIMGDTKALSSIRGLNVKKLNQMVKLKDITINPVNTDYLIEGYVYRNH